MPVFLDLSRPTRPQVSVIRCRMAVQVRNWARYIILTGAGYCESVVAYGLQASGTL
jgi:hypothetical protein